MIELPTPLIQSKGSVKLTPEQVGVAVIEKFEQMRNLRQPVEDKWDEVYELYRASTDDMRNQKQRAFRSAGSARDWRHRVNVGITFDVVETLVAYLKGATFPSDDWFDVKAMEPNLADAARLVKELCKLKLEQVAIRNVVDEWLRHLIIYGTATYRVNWRDEVKRTVKRKFQPDILSSYTDIELNERVGCLDIQVITPHNIWLDTSAPLNKGGVFSRLQLTREELHALVVDGYYTLDTETVKRYEDYRFGDPGTDKATMHDSNRGNDEIIEYYGPMLVDGVQFWCVHAVFYGRRLIRLTDSQYWCGVPYVTATLLPDRDSIYGMSVLHPNLGALHILNVLTNSRLDNIALHIDKMWTMVEDGILKRDQVKTKPGAVFKVAQHDSLRPVDLGRADFTVTYNEAQVQEQAVYRNTSTGPLIGNAQPRSGERVTAAEIQGVRDAGGNRLSSVHARVEDTATLPLLEKVFSVMQQYYITPETIRMYVPEMDATGFFQVDPEFLHYPYKFLPLGATYVVERERTMTDLLQLLDISGRVPQIGEQLNYGLILEDLLRQMRFTNPQRYIMQQQQGQAAPPEAAMPPAPQEGAPPSLPPELAASLGDANMAAGYQQELMTDGGAGAMADLGIDTSAIDPATLGALTSQLSQQVQG